MIKAVIGRGSIIVDGGYPSYPYFSMNSNPMTGMVRFNPSNQNTEVFDGTGWSGQSSASPMIGLSPIAETAIAWAITKMENEAYILGLSKEYPAVKNLLDQQNDIKHKIDMVVALVKPEVKV